MSEKATTTRNQGIDALKLVAAALVVGIHTGFLKETSPLGSHVCLDALFRVAVAVFFLTSGFFFFRGATPTRIGGWLKRVAWLYALWSVAYLPWWWPGGKVLLVGYWHLWFLPALLGGGALLYVLRNLDDRQLLGIAAGLFSIGLLLQYAGSYHLLVIAEKKYLFRNALFFGFPLMSLGFVFARSQVVESGIRAGRTLALGMGILVLEGLLSFRTHETFDLLLGQALAAPALFLLAARWRPRFTIPAELSTAIYFLHPLGVLALYRAGLKDGTPLTLAVLALALLGGVVLVAVNRRWRFFL